jgi:hypothetical protein
VRALARTAHRTVTQSVGPRHDARPGGGATAVQPLRTARRAPGSALSRSDGRWAVAVYRSRGWDLLRAVVVAACCVHGTTTRRSGCVAAGQGAAMASGARPVQSGDRVSGARSADGLAGRVQAEADRRRDGAATGGRWRRSRATARSSSVIGRTSGCVSRSSATSRARPVRHDVRSDREDSEGRAKVWQLA